ncbi:DUF4232 domain-containing protein [Streptomyces sp. NPDC003635]
MRTTALLPLTALAAALLLTSCGDDGSDAGGGDGKRGESSTAACAIGDMETRVGPANPAPAAGDTGNVTLTLTNKGAACALDGMPAVTLKADDRVAAVAPDAAAPKRTLAKGGTTSFTVTYVRGGTDGLAVKTVEFALPGADGTRSFPWSYGDVALKGERPDASVSGFQQGD